MAESRRAEVGGGLYERLLQRLALALQEADTATRLHQAPPDELELSGLTPAELELIRAYLDRDLNWLRGRQLLDQRQQACQQAAGAGGEQAAAAWQADDQETPAAVLRALWHGGPGAARRGCAAVQCVRLQAVSCRSATLALDYPGRSS